MAGTFVYGSVPESTLCFVTGLGIFQETALSLQSGGAKGLAGLREATTNCQTSSTQ